MSTKLIGRKIAQIAAASWGDSHDIGTALYALCEDGTLWCLHTNEWQRIYNPPTVVPERNRK